MHLIPPKKEDLQNLVPALFKAWIVGAYLVWKLCNLYVSNEIDAFKPPLVVVAGYVLSIIVLSFVAGVQKGRKQNQAALRTLVFILIALVFLSISFQIGLVLTQAAFIAEVLVNSVVLFYAFRIHRAPGMRAVTFWIWGCSISLIRLCGIVIWNYGHQQADSFQNSTFQKSFWGLLYNFPTGSFAEFYWLGSLCTGVLLLAGVILAIQQLRNKEHFTVSLNTSMFVALGFLASMILMAVSVVRFESQSLLPFLAINAVLLYFCLVGYRETKAIGFLFLAATAMLAITRTIGVEGMNWYHQRLHDGTIYTFEQAVLGLIQSASILGIILFGTGMILLVQRISPDAGNADIARPSEMRSY